MNRPTDGGIRKYFKSPATDSPRPPISPHDDPAKLAPELFDESSVSSSSSSPKMPIVQRSDPFDLNVPPLPPQYQLIPFPVNISQSEQFLIHDTIPFLFRGKCGIPLVDALGKRCNDVDRRDSPTATSNSFTLRLRVGTPAPRTVILNGQLT